MYKNILLLLDCSDVDKGIIGHTIELAHIHKSRVHLFHVIHAHTLDQERMMETKKNKIFSKTIELFEKEGIAVDSSSIEGEPEKEVLKKAREDVWDLIAMATHGHKGFSDFLLGSVSDVLKHKLKKPLLLLHR